MGQANADFHYRSGPIVQTETEADSKNLSVPRKGKGKTHKKEWTEEDEGRFVHKLEKELEKVHQKQQIKVIEIQRRIQASERDVKDLVRSLNERGPGQDGPSEEEFMVLEEDLSDIIADVHDLQKFTQVNYTGFHKIMKKHDVSGPLQEDRASYADHWTRK